MVESREQRVSQLMTYLKMTLIYSKFEVSIQFRHISFIICAMEDVDGNIEQADQKESIGNSITEAKFF